MNQPFVLMERSEPQITVLTMNRPDKRNALNLSLLQELDEAIKETQERTDQRAIILKGAGPLFSAGMDLMEAGNPDTSEQLSNQLAKLLTTLHDTPLITIALVHGSAIAGGAGLVAACDLAYAEESALLGFPEVKRGLVASQIMIFLMRQLRQRDLRELLLIGDMIDAKKAFSIGLINAVFPMSKIESEVRKIAQQVIKGAPKAIANTKKLLDDLYPSNFEDDIWKAIEVHKKVREDGEFAEGIKAFLEKREPHW